MPYLFIAPMVIYLLCFGAYPLVGTIYLSLYRYNPVISLVPKFVGFDNYLTLFLKDETFLLVFRNTLFLVFGSTILQFSLGLATAILLNKKIKGRTFFRCIVLIPWVTPIIVVGFAWRWMLDPSWGLINYYLKQLGIISEYVVWLGRDDTVWVALFLVSTWKGLSFMCVMLLAGLQGIPGVLYESAQVEGANRMKCFWYITVPLVKPIILITVLLGTIVTWNNFRLVWVLTEGGPGYSTSVISTYVYTRSFQDFSFGQGSAVATISFLFVLVLTVVYFRFARQSIFPK